MLTPGDRWFLAVVACLLMAASLWTRVAGELTDTEASRIVERALAAELDLNPADLTVFTIRGTGRERTVDARVRGATLELRFAKDLAGWQWTGVRPEDSDRTLTIAEYAQSIRDAHEEAAAAAVQMLDTGEVAARLQGGTYLDADALVSRGLLEWDVAQKPPPGYRVRVEVIADGFRVLATPTAYPRNGVRSFYSDSTLVVRAADRQGRDAGPGDPEWLPR